MQLVKAPTDNKAKFTYFVVCHMDNAAQTVNISDLTQDIWLSETREKKRKMEESLNWLYLDIFASIIQ